LPNRCDIIAYIVFKKTFYNYVRYMMELSRNLRKEISKEEHTEADDSHGK